MSLRNQIMEKIPERLQGLVKLAYNYWWTWDKDGQRVFPKIDPYLWELSGNNAVLFLHMLKENSWNELLNNSKYLSILDRAVEKFEKYMSTEHPQNKTKKIGYLCAEYGIHKSLPIYSGGLGVLAGDHLKEASDLGLEFRAVGLLYWEGYFVQRLSTTGDQVEEYSPFDPVYSPLFIVRNKDDSPLLINIPLGMHEVKARVWELSVGKSKLYLLDTNIPENTPEDREITSRLYQGDRVLRIRQETLLGIGGMKVFNSLGFKPDVIHLNEGHTAFAGIELLRKYMYENYSYEEALEKTREKFVFTTHTPVPAGHDVFSDNLVVETLGSYLGSFGAPHKKFLELGKTPMNGSKYFNMTALAINFSRKVNGVSKLNAEIMNKMWAEFFKTSNSRVKEIIPITNGVHMPTWIHPLMKDLYEKYLPSEWKENVDQKQTWQVVDSIPDEELWEKHLQIKEQFVNFIRTRIRKWVTQRNLDTSLVYASGVMLDPNVLTIGFARRFASYKRAPLIFSDPERLKRILTDPKRPVQLVFSGKAHPNDEAGKQFLHQVTKYAMDPEFQGRIAFIQDYEMEVARHMIAGVDVWLNNPRIPREASGTSGEKAAANGVINLSTADGWWREGYNGKNGWVIGTFELEVEDSERDVMDAQSLYKLLEKEIVPSYYKTQNNGISKDWIKTMKESIKTVSPFFNTKRMLKDYLTKIYYPAN